jgi:hypothetical protein
MQNDWETAFRATTDLRAHSAVRASERSRYGTRAEIFARFLSLFEPALALWVALHVTPEIGVIH